MSDRLRVFPMFTKFIEQATNGDDVSILDLGCGSLCSAFHSRYGDKYVGLEMNGAPFNMDVCGDAHDLSRFADDSFDVVTLWSVIEHLYNPYQAMKEATRVAKRVVLLTTDYTERDKDRSRNHYYAWTPKTFKKFLSLFGEANVWVELSILCGLVKLD